MSVDAETLPAFLEHVPAYYDHDPWPTVAGWDQFDLTVTSVLRDSSGTTPDQAPDSSTPPDPGARLDLKTEGSDDQIAAAVDWFNSLGALHQPRISQTATFDVFRGGHSHPVLVVIDDTLDAGTLVDFPQRGAPEQAFSGQFEVGV